MNDLPIENTASWLKGFWFVFKDSENTIVAGGSSVTGKEYVYINEKLFSEKRSLKKISAHELEYGENKYKIIFNVKSLLTGKVECSFFTNGELTKTYKVSFQFSFVKFIFCLIIAGSCGLIGTYFSWPLWVITPFMVLMLLLFVVLFKPSKDFGVEEDAA